MNDYLFFGGLLIMVFGFASLMFGLIWLNQARKFEVCAQYYADKCEELREALSFYADETNYEITGEKFYIGHGDFTEETWIVVDLDRGKRAQEALKVQRNKEV